MSAVANLRTPFNPQTRTIPALPKILAQQLLQIRARRHRFSGHSNDWSSPVLSFETRLRALLVILFKPDLALVLLPKPYGPENIPPCYKCLIQFYKCSTIQK